MIILHLSNRYQKESKNFVKGNKKNLSELKKAMRLFIENPYHPSLNMEKLKHSSVWTIRVDKGNRIFFTWIDINNVLFIDIGPHDKYRSY